MKDYDLEKELKEQLNLLRAQHTTQLGQIKELDRSTRELMTANKELREQNERLTLQLEQSTKRIEELLNINNPN